MSITVPGILVVNRIGFLKETISRRNIQNIQPSLQMTREEIFCRYRGFDGKAWPQADHLPISMEDGLAPMDSLSIVREYYRRIDHNNECDIIILVHPNVAASSMEKIGCRLLGFDVGFYDSELAHFSAILNEVLFGFAPDMRALTDRFNESLLLSSIQDAYALLSVHYRLLSVGVPLEDCCAFEPIAVFSPPQ